MIKAFIFDADGPLYQRGEASKTQKIELLKKYGFNADYDLFDKAYNTEKFKAYVQAESAAEMFLTDSFFSAEEKWPWFKRLGMDTYLDEIISSFDIKSLKDTTEAYQVCLSRLGVSAKEAVFVGHQQYEMDGAKKAGISSICLKSIAIPPDTKGDYTIDSLAEIKSVLSSI